MDVGPNETFDLDQDEDAADLQSYIYADEAYIYADASAMQREGITGFTEMEEEIYEGFEDL